MNSPRSPSPPRKPAQPPGPSGQRTAPSHASVHPSPKGHRGPRPRADSAPIAAAPRPRARLRDERRATQAPDTDDLQSPSIWAGVAITARTQAWRLRRGRSPSRARPQLASGACGCRSAYATRRSIRAKGVRAELDGATAAVTKPGLLPNPGCRLSCSGGGSGRRIRR